MEKRHPGKGHLRSQLWFDDPDNPDMTALHLERYLNFGLTGEELQSGGPIIGIAQTGSDLVPCNRHHIELAKRVKDGIRAAGDGIALVQTGDPIRIDLGRRQVDLLVDAAELGTRRAKSLPGVPENQTPWQQLYRAHVGQLSTGGSLELADPYRDTLRERGEPRDSH